jgi:hypothetical protein
MILCHTVFLSAVLEPLLFHVHHIFSHFLIILHCVFLCIKIRHAHNLVGRPLPSAPAVKLAAVDPWRSRPCLCVRLCAGHLGTVRCPCCLCCCRIVQEGAGQKAIAMFLPALGGTAVPPRALLVGRSEPAPGG